MPAGHAISDIGHNAVWPSWSPHIESAIDSIPPGSIPSGSFPAPLPTACGASQNSCDTAREPELIPPSPTQQASAPQLGPHRPLCRPTQLHNWIPCANFLRALHHLFQIVYKDNKENWPQYSTLQDTAGQLDLTLSITAPWA